MNAHCKGERDGGTPVAPTEAEPAAPTVIVIGPGPDQVGGMASVVAQMVAMDFGGRYHVRLLPVTLAADARESLSGRVIRHIRQMRRLRSAISRSCASITHIHTCSGFSFYRATADMLLVQRLGCRVILHIHGAAFDAFYAGGSTWRRRIIAWSLSRADRVVALSNGWRNKLREMAPNARLVVIENAVEMPPEQPTSRKDGPCRFLLLARMDEWKGIDDLLHACAELHGGGIAIELVLAGPPGTAGDATHLNEKIRARNLETVVRYVGPVYGEKKSDLLVQADVYVQPSHHEGMPIAMLEALAHGLPIVATRVGAVPEVIVDRQHGLLVPPRRPDLLARAMRDLTSDRKRRRTMSDAARSLAQKRFSMTRFRNDLVLLYGGIRVSYPGRVDARHGRLCESPVTAR
ncbi:MAG: glycosyltransferase family 4 protein [Phycisphaerae bacterium]